MVTLQIFLERSLHNYIGILCKDLHKLPMAKVSTEKFDKENYGRFY